MTDTQPNYNKARQTSSMSIPQTTSEKTSAGQLFCPHCKALSTLRATFWASCGERFRKKKQTVLINEQDIHTHYRITTLVRRYPSSNLYFALDNQRPQECGQTRMVAIRDIDISGLTKDARDQAITLAQREYDHLRHWNIPHTLACIDLRLSQGHLFLVSGLPVSSSATGKEQRLYTLQDFLQSGLGLPRESRTLEWIRSLCQAVEQLHRQGIVLGDLDPYTVVLDKNSAQAEPKLLPFWLPPELRKLMPPPDNAANSHVSYSKAPEELLGDTEVHTDLYIL